MDAPRGCLGSYPKSYYESAIEAGRILVSGKRVKCQYEIQGGDELSHTVHRHEPEVTLSEFRETKYPSEQSPVEIVYEDENMSIMDTDLVDTDDIDDYEDFDFNDDTLDIEQDDLIDYDDTDDYEFDDDEEEDDEFQPEYDVSDIEI